MAAGRDSQVVVRRGRHSQDGPHRAPGAQLLLANESAEGGQHQPRPAVRHWRLISMMISEANAKKSKLE